MNRKSTKRASRTTIIHAAPKGAHIAIGTAVEHASGRGVVVEAYVGFSFVQMANGTTITAANHELQRVDVSRVVTPTHRASPLRRTRDGEYTITSHSPRITFPTYVWTRARRRSANIKRHRVTFAMHAHSVVRAPISAR
jgi:hypothetical protein